MKPKTWVLAAAIIVVGAIAASAVIVTSSAHRTTLAPQGPPVSTASVVEGKLSAIVSKDGTLTYQGQPDGTPYSVINQAAGTYTKLPPVGQVISQGEVLYRADDSPVVLLYGPTPAYRTLSLGATGADVAELNADLVALGYASAAELNPTSASFGTATASALQKLQATLGVTQNGVLSLGQAVFEPTALRVTIVSAQLGASTQSGQTVMQASSTARQVQVALAASEQTDVAVGDKVTITLPNNKATPGVVSSVGAIATCPSSSTSGGSTPSVAAPGTDACTSARSGTSTPTIAVYITPSDATATGTWDQAPVKVGITTASVPHALAVPVTALVAQSGGGYAVEMVDASGPDRLVTVSLGLFDDAEGLVQVTGAGLAAGQKVVVPAT